jgi:hypothetical protein
VRKFAFVALLASVGCEDLPPDRTAEHADVRRSFEAWAKTLVKGEFPAAWAGMTTGYKSQWLFDLLVAGDATAHAWRRSLTGETRTTVDLWYNFHKDKNVARVPALPVELIDSPTVVGIWKTVCEEAAPELKSQMAKLEIVEIYSDGAGATVTVRNIRTTTEMYEMVPGRGGWLINHYVGSRRQVPR